MKHNPNSAAKVRRWTIPQRNEPEDVASPAPECAPPGEDGVRFGYTLADLDRFARRAITQNLSWWRGADRHDQYDTAWSAIAEYLCAARQAPSALDLIAVGSAALSVEANAYRHHHGIPRTGGESGQLPRFTAYWHQPQHDPWSDAVVDRVALGQILAGIKPAHRKALTLYGAGAGADSVAKALGITVSTYKQRLSRARTEFRELWFAPDSPPALHGDVVRRKAGTLNRTHCTAGHELTGETLRWEKPRRPGWAPTWRCRVCESERSARRSASAGTP